MDDEDDEEESEVLDFFFFFDPLLLDFRILSSRRNVALSSFFCSFFVIRLAWDFRAALSAAVNPPSPPPRKLVPRVSGGVDFARPVRPDPFFGIRGPLAVGVGSLVYRRYFRYVTCLSVSRHGEDSVRSAVKDVRRLVCFILRHPLDRFRTSERMH